LSDDDDCIFPDAAKKIKRNEDEPNMISKESEESKANNVKGIFGKLDISKKSQIDAETEEQMKEEERIRYE